MATYLYRKSNPALEQLPLDLPTLTPASSVWSLTDELSLVYDSALDAGDKATLDDYMVNHESGPYVFVSQT
jgi:hypothetical protein